MFLYGYTIPIIALLTVFMATLTSLRFIITRQGAYWIIPCIISLILTVLNLDTLITIAETEVFPDYRNDFREFAGVLISILWYLMIITFHYALRYKVESNRYRNENRKNRAEAEYISKIEKRRDRKERKLEAKQHELRVRRAKLAASHKPKYYEEDEAEKWTDLFTE